MSFTRPPSGCWPLLVIMACALSVFAQTAQAQAADDEGLPPPADRAVDFAADILPILEDKCLSCHGAEKREGGLRLDQRDAAMLGGDSGQVIERGQSIDSELLWRIAEEDETLRMPPKGEPLDADQVGLVRAWIDQGANWPDELARGKAGTAEAKHWSFRTPVRPELPPVHQNDWVRTPIDRFLLAKLEAEDVAPAPEATRQVLIRRLCLDLLGLPPTAEEVEAFVADQAPDAYERLVDRLLASPRFGERFGRHWLDLARYADSDGYEKDTARPDAYRYRDWVINAINRDLPFDQFTLEQLAGDLLPEPTVDQKTAVGFHRNTLTNKEGGADQEEFRVAAVIDRVNTTGAVWLGLTVGCAQCHTHKYDPILQREYYQLFAFFNTSNEVDLPIDPPPAEEAKAEADSGDKKAKDRTKAPSPVIRTLAEPEDASKRRTTHVLTRGDFLRPGDEVKPGTPAFLPDLNEGDRESKPTRADLARWLVSTGNPLAARVEMNRLWGHLFGRALVTTLDDFGLRGEPPSHPELLDWLATEFSRQGWSRKAMIRLIVTSAAYRQSSAGRPELFDRDPTNTWLARQNRFRPEAEVMRDLFLAAGGLLSERLGGPSVHPTQPAGISELTYANSARWVESEGADRYRRGLYTWFQRTSPYPMLTTFDAPDANTCLVRRERSNTPLQALTLLNDQVFLECARGLASRILKDADSTAEDRLDSAYRTALGRVPDPFERQALLVLLERFQRDFANDLDAAKAFAGDLSPARASATDIAAWVGVTRAILNLDEFLTRE